MIKGSSKPPHGAQRRVSLPLLNQADVLLGEPSLISKLLLSKPKCNPGSSHVAAKQDVQIVRYEIAVIRLRRIGDPLRHQCQFQAPVFPR